jgi:NitT/TauT family transport system substrate-binding protein
MGVTRRQFLTGLSAGAATILLAACGSSPTATVPPPSARPSAASSASAAPGSASSAASPTVPPSAATPTVARAAATPSTTGTALKTVRAGFVPVNNWGPLFIAIEKGYFREQGIETVATQFTSGTDIITQTVAGQLDVGPSGLGASQHAESPPMATPLVVAKKKYDDGTYRQVAALKGKKVAINGKGVATEYWLYSALKKNNLTMKDIDLQVVPFDQVAAALDSGALDGSMLSEPWPTLAEQKSLIQRLADDFLINAQGTVVCFNQKWGRESGVADKWLAAWLRGARDLSPQGYKLDENTAILEKYTRTPKDVIKATRPPLHNANGALNLDDMKAQQEYFLSSGSLTYTDPLDLATIVDTSYVEGALKIIGRA